MKTAFKVIVITFSCSMWALWIAGAIWNASEQRRVDRESRALVEAYNASIEQIRAIRGRSSR